MNKLSIFETQLVDVLEAAKPIRARQALSVTTGSGRQGSSTRDACQEAIAKAIALRRLKAQYHTTGFLALPLDQYLSRIARLASVTLPIRLAESRSDSFSARLSQSLSLARQLDLAIEHLRLWVRAWFAAEFQGTQMAGAVMARGHHLAPSSGAQRGVLGLEETASAGRVQTELQRVEAAYTDSQREQVNTALQSLA